MSQTHIFNFTPGSVHSGTILKTLSLFANRHKNSYVPSRNIWLSKRYFHRSASKQKQCLTVDTQTVNDLGPGKFRMQANNGTKQVCYYNRNKSNTSFNSFLVMRKQTSQKGAITFSIDKVITNLNNSNVSYIELGNELKKIDRDNFQSKLQQLGNGNTTIRRPANKNRVRDRNEQQSDKIMDMDESAKSHNFFQDNKAVKVKYTTTRIKSRNLLFNIAYVGINKEDYYNKNFIFGVYLLLTKNFNPFSLDRKLANKTKHEVIYMLWRECMLIEYYKFICEENNFLHLNGKNVLQPKVLQITADFIEKDEKNI